MNRTARNRARHGTVVAVCVFAAAAALGLTPAPGHATKVCDECASASDTASTPGKTALPRDLYTFAQFPPIAFIGSNHRLRCAVRAGAGWHVDVVDSVSIAAGCAITVDPQGGPMISYHSGNGALLLARPITGGGWSIEQVDPLAVGVGGSTSIANVPGGIGIAYYDSAAGRLKYAERIGVDAWQVTPITAGAIDQGRYPSLVAEGPMRAISYYDATNGDLRLALGQAGSWSTSLIDGAGNVGGYSSLIGNPTASQLGIGYYDFTSAHLKYAFETAGGGWTIETVDAQGDVGRSCSAVGFGDSPAVHAGIGYYDRTNGDLKYAQKQMSSWTPTVQDAAGNVGVSVACGSTPAPNDTIGLAYVDDVTGSLYYQWHAGTLESVPQGGEVSAALHLEWRRAAGGAGGRVRFSVPKSGPVRVAFYDAQGRVVAVPLRQALSAGAAEVGWDGRDAGGHAVATGVLFVRVETAGGSGSAAAVILH